MYINKYRFEGLNMYTIRKSKLSDIEQIMNLFDMARKTMATLGIDQWQDGYPYKENIMEDIRNDESYVVTGQNGEILATFMLMKRNESTYDRIYDGAWLTEKEVQYATIHRITVLPESRASAVSGKEEKPISRIIIEYAKDFVKEHNLSGGIKIDTHEGNIAMRKMLEKNGFVYCGVILLADGQKRVAYQLL